MNATDRPQFDDLMRSLYAGLDLPLPAEKLTALWDGIGTKLSLVEVTRIREGVLADLGNPSRRGFVFGPRGRFGAAELWDARERMRGMAPPRPPAAAESPAAGDPWTQAGIARAGSHWCRRLARYAHPTDLPPSLGGTMAPGRLPESWQPHPVTRELRAPLLEAAASWAEDVRGMARALGAAPSKADQDLLWRDWLAVADRKVDAIRTRHELGEPIESMPPAPRHHQAPATQRMPEVIEAAAVAAEPA